MNDSLMHPYEIEKKSFFRYATRLGIEPEALAHKIMGLIKSRFNDLKRVSDGIYPVDYFIKEYQIDFDNPTIDSFLDVSRKSIVNYSDRVINDLVRFLLNNGNLYNIDISLLKILAKNNGINIENKYWFHHYLKKIPIIQLFDNDLNAYVAPVDSIKYSVVLNRTLNDSLERYLFPTIINLIFTENTDGNLNLNPRTECDFENAADVVAQFAAFYLGKISEEQLKLDLNFIKITKYVSGLNFYLHHSAMDFVLLHEYSHIILGHMKTESHRWDEVSADVLAYNVLLNENTGFNQSDCSEWMHYRAIAPISLIYFLLSIESIHGFRTSKTHPHLFLRLKYLLVVANLIIGNMDGVKDELNNLFQFLSFLFSKTMQKFADANQMVKALMELDETFLDGFEFKVVPNGSHPVIFSIDPSSFRRGTMK